MKTDSEPLHHSSCSQCGHPSRPILDYENPYMWRSVTGKEGISRMKPMATAISRLLSIGSVLGKVIMHKQRESLWVY